MNDLLILNGNPSVNKDLRKFVCVEKTFNMIMGDGFMSAITEPPSFKEYIVSESKLEHGQRYILDDEPKFQQRDVSLSFILVADSPEERRAKYNAFMNHIIANKGQIILKIPSESNTEVYKLILVGKSGEYSLSLDRCIAKYMFKFVEPNPTDRTY